MVFTLCIGEVFHVKSSCFLWFDFVVLCRFLAVASNTGALSGCVRCGLDSMVYALLRGMRERGVPFGRFALPRLFLENTEELCFIVLRR